MPQPAAVDGRALRREGFAVLPGAGNAALRVLPGAGEDPSDLAWRRLLPHHTGPVGDLPLNRAAPAEFAVAAG